MERAVEIFAAIQLLVIGLSHIVQRHAWVELFVWLRGKGHAGVFVNGFLSLGVGAFIVAFHHVWTGLPVVITLLGWAQVVKGLVALVAPSWSMRGLERVSHERAHEFVIGGVFFLVLGALAAYVALR